MQPRVLIWNECRHEKEDQSVAEVYPETIGGAIQNGLQSMGIDALLSTLDDPYQGLSPDVLENIDVLLWWGHRYHGEIEDHRVEYLQKRVLAGMGLIVLHSGHHAKLFKALMGTSCNLAWREADEGERERLWALQPSHPIANGIPPNILLPQSEMYGEPFDVPDPDELVFASWYQGGELLRSGLVYRRGRGKVFYFSPGHETFPIYRDHHIQRILANAVAYVAPSHSHGWGLENWGRPIPEELNSPLQTKFKKPRKK